MGMPALDLTIRDEIQLEGVSYEEAIKAERTSVPEAARTRNLVDVGIRVLFTIFSALYHGRSKQRDMPRTDSQHTAVPLSSTVPRRFCKRRTNIARRSDRETTRRIFHIVFRRSFAAE
jgi:hypothetical protein